MSLGCCCPRKRSGARTCQTLCVWLKSWTTDTCEDREKEGRREEKGKKENGCCCLLCVCVRLPTNTLSSPFPPSLAHSLEFSSIQFSPPQASCNSTLPHLTFSSSSSSEPTTAKLWTLVSEICTSAQLTSSDYRCKWVGLPLPAASRSTYPAVLRHPTPAEKGGHRRPPLRGWRQDSRDTCQTVTSGGWRLDTDLLRLLPIASAADTGFIHYFFSHTLTLPFLSPWFGNWLWTVNLVGGYLEGFIAFTGCQDAAHRDGHNHQQVGQDHWQCESHPGSLFLVVARCASCGLRVAGDS